MPTFDDGGVALWYETHGEGGDPVALVHGSLSDHRSWEAVLGPLSTALQVVTYDRRGYGRSAGPRRVHAVREDAADLAVLLERTELFPAHIVAHSYAGAVALRLAVDRPELVRSLALHEAPLIRLLANDPEFSSEVHRWLDLIATSRSAVASGEFDRAAHVVVDAFSMRPGAWDRLRPEARLLATETIGLWSDEFADPESTLPDLPALDDVWVPVLLTQGGESPPVVRRIVATLAGSLRNVTCRTIEGAGHAPHLTSPDPYVGILSTFLLERVVPTV